jgi:pilus assembly protein Flp/PilA
MLRFSSRSQSTIKSFLRRCLTVTTKNFNGVNSMIGKIFAFVRDEDGATAIEYGLIAALVSVAAIGALTAMGNSLSTMFNTVSSSLSNAAGG